MPTLVDYVNRFPGRRFIVVGKGRTPFDYARLSETTDPVIFLNDAVQLAPLARRSSERFFFAHDARQAVWLPEHPDVTAVLARAPDAVEEDVVHPHNQRLFARDLAAPPARLVTYEWGGRFGEEVGRKTREETARDGRLLISLGGTIHSALHFAWLCGASEIAFIGCDGRPGGYDKRIAIQSGTPNLGVHARIREGQDRLCGWLGMETEYVGKRLDPLIPRILHFVWLNGEPPDWVRQTLEAFAAVNGDKWDVKLWREMPADLPPALATAVAGCYQICQQADILYCWLLDQFGGFVFDCDHVPLRSLEPLRRGREAWTTNHNAQQRWLTNGAMGAVAGSRAFRRILAEIPKVRNRGGKGRNLQRGMAGGRIRRCAYGPDLLTYLFVKQGDRDMSLLPWHYFYSFFGREAHQARRLRAMDADGRHRTLAKIKNRFSDGQWPYTVHEWGVQGSSHREVAHAEAAT